MRVFVYVDGDGVGQRLESLIISGDLVGAARLSETVARALGEVEEQLREAGAEIVFAGGDNTLAHAHPDTEFFQSLLALFHEETGITASAGVGVTPTEAYLGLQMAKSLGGGRLVTWDGRAVAEERGYPVDRPRFLEDDQTVH